MKVQFRTWYSFLLACLAFIIIEGTNAANCSAAAVSLPWTGQTVTFAADDDGVLQKGATWPDPRFANNADGTTRDNLTGLIWATDTRTPGPASCNPGTRRTWQAALAYVDCLNTNSYLDYADWRLPNVRELLSIVNYGQADSMYWLRDQGFTNVVELNLGATWWSSTVNVSSVPPLSQSWVVHVDYTFPGPSVYAWDSNYYVWPVRGGAGGVVSLPATGQTVSYAAGDDGDLQKGVAWPSPRFTNNGNGTTTDNLTGLMWTTEANAPGPGCSSGSLVVWQDALSYVACLNANSYLGHADWRLPNVNEVESLTNYGATDHGQWLTQQGFGNVTGYDDDGEGTITYWERSFWSSTSNVPSGDYKWTLFTYGWLSVLERSGQGWDNHNAWAVRDGR